MAVVLSSLLHAGLIVRPLRNAGGDVVARVMAMSRFVIDGAGDTLLLWRSLP